MKKNILQLHDSAGLYGAEAVILSLSQALQKTQYNAIIGCITGMKNSQPELGRTALGRTAEEKNIDVEYFPTMMQFDLRVILRLGKVLHERAVKLIHAHGYKSNLIGLVASKLFNVPIITTNHLFPLMPLDDKKLQFYSRLDVSFTMNKLDKIVAVSEQIKNILVMKGIEKSKLLVIDNGIDIDKYASRDTTDNSHLRDALQIGSGDFVIGTFGRLTSQKGHIYLLEAAKLLLEQNIPAIFLIAGDGPLRGELERRADELNITKNLRFLGYRKDTVDLLKIMDVFVMTSVDEGLPMAMIEAMAAHTPVVVTSVGAIPKVIRDYENGILVEARNSELIANRLIVLLNDSNLRNKLAENAEQTVKMAHSKESMCSKYLEVYDDIIERHP